jgi:glycosyltransferase involved in cell wall biosynthesis
MENGEAKVALFVFGLNARRIGGIEMHTREMTKLLGERGWNVVLCFRQPPPDDVRAFLSAPGVTLEQLPNAAENSRQGAAELFGLLRRCRPALVHFQFTPFLGPNAWIARLCGARGIFVTDHGSHPEGFNARRAPAWKRLIGRFLNLPVTRAVAVSDYNRGVLATIGTIAPSRLTRIYNGVDPARGLKNQDSMARQFRQRHGIPRERILVIQVSWIIPEKGVADVLEAARIASAEEPALHFAFAGDGAHREEYSRRAGQTGIADRVTWLGLVQDPIGEGLFAAADICCQASRWQEAFGLVIAEAMAFAKPVCATRVGGIPEIVEDGGTGFLVDRGDTAALAARFVQLARDSELRRRLGLAGARRVEEKFDLRRNAEELLKIYGLRSSTN